MSFWRVAAEGIEVFVRASPKGGRDAVDGVAALADGRIVLKVRVRAAPEDGAATAAVLRVLASAAGVAPARVRLTAGATARLKTFHVAGEPAGLGAALEAAAANPTARGAASRR